MSAKRPKIDKVKSEEFGVSASAVEGSFLIDGTQFCANCGQLWNGVKCDVCKNALVCLGDGPTGYWCCSEKPKWVECLKCWRKFGCEGQVRAFDTELVPVFALILQNPAWNEEEVRGAPNPNRNPAVVLCISPQGGGWASRLAIQCCKMDWLQWQEPIDTVGHRATKTCIAAADGELQFPFFEFFTDQDDGEEGVLESTQRGCLEALESMDEGTPILILVTMHSVGETGQLVYQECEIPPPKDEDGDETAVDGGAKDGKGDETVVEGGKEQKADWLPNVSSAPFHSVSLRMNAL